MKLTDLHGQATQIAQEFKTIETSFGTHCLSKLLPLVLGVLERLELYIDEYEKLQTENAKINLKLSGQDHFDSASSGLDNYVVVVAPSDSEALKTLQRAVSYFFFVCLTILLMVAKKKEAIGSIATFSKQR